MNIKPPYKVRTQDIFGSGHWKASRGTRTHKGVDLCCSSGDVVLAVSCGKVTKVGFPYNQSPCNPSWSQEACIKHEHKRRMRYVEVTDLSGLRVRYMYIQPLVVVGEVVHKGHQLGVVQGVAQIYPGITEHFHFEVLKADSKEDLDPNEYLLRLTCEP